MDTVGGAIRYYDAQVDDARLVTTLARTAASLGAAVVTSVRRDRDPAIGPGGHRGARCRHRIG
jgi:glycerol-3-phosphate dehydrogenase